MPLYEFDARINTTIKVFADDESAAEAKATKIYERLTIIDSTTQTEYGADTEDGIELVDVSADITEGMEDA
jgi:hypothetical protein